MIPCAHWPVPPQPRQPLTCCLRAQPILDTTHKYNHTVCHFYTFGFFHWAGCPQGSSPLLPVPALHSFFWLSNLSSGPFNSTFLFIHPSVDGHWAVCYLLAIIMAAAKNIHIQVSNIHPRTFISTCRPVFSFLLQEVRKGIVGSCGQFMFNSLRNQTFLQSDYPNLHSQWQYMKFPVFPYPCQQVFIIAI